MIVVRLSIDQDQIRFDMTIAVIGPIAREWMIKVVNRQRFVGNHQFENFSQGGIERLAVPS